MSQEVISVAEATIDEVVVTATRTPHSIHAVPASISVINRRGLEKISFTYTDEALRGVAGVFVRRTKPADQTGYVSLRGFSGSARTLVLLDGVPMNDGYNQSVNWRAIPVEAITRVEIVKGSFSSLYGGSAMGGVINILTEIPKKENITLKANYGTFNTFNVAAAYSNRFLKDDKLGVFFSVSQISSDGYPANLFQTGAVDGAGNITANGWQKTTNNRGAVQYLLGHQGYNWLNGTQLYGRISYEIKPGSTLDFSVSSGIDAYGYKNSRTFLTDQTTGLPVNDGIITIEDDGVQKRITVRPHNFLGAPGNQYTNVFRLHGKTNINNAQLSAYVGFLDDHSRYETILAGATADGGTGRTFSSPRQNLIANIQTDIPLGNNSLSVGADYKIYTASVEEWNIANWINRASKTELSFSMSGKQTFFAPFAQAEINIFDGLKTCFGVRYDFWLNNNGMGMQGADETIYPKTTKHSLSPKAGIVYSPRLNSGLVNIKSIRASAGRSFRTPTLFNLYRTSTSATLINHSNPDLKPETAFSWDVGINISLFNNYTKIGFDYFQSYVTDLIYNSELEAGTPRVTKTVNAAEGAIKGVEVELRQTVFSFLEINFNLTRQHTEIKANFAEPQSIGKRFTNVPDLIYNAGINFDKEPVTFQLTYNFTGKYFTASDNSDVVQGVYGSFDGQKLLDAKISYMLHKNISLSLAVNNILDREYFLFFQAPGRTFTFSVSAKF